MQAPRGFRLSAVAAGVKTPGRLDVGLIAADDAVPVAAVFTRNVVRAAPVVLAEERARRGVARAVLVNSGCANACTGGPGYEAALETTRALATALGASEGEVLPASTGVIGALLPADRIIACVGELVARLGGDPDGFSRAILTTDRWPKVAGESLGNGKASLLGIAKGAGMIHPDLGELEPGSSGATAHATLLGFFLTDVVVERAALQRCLQAATDATFNASSVDGDTSTNDALFLLASGKSGYAPSPDELLAGLTRVSQSLARSVVADGEGSEHVVTLRVSGLATDEAARLIARTVGTSLLVKTALYGKDPNWGRILAAAGRAGVRFDPHQAEIDIDGVVIVRGGTGVGAEAEREAAARLGRPSYAIGLRLGLGPGEYAFEMCDLGHGYVDVNASYRS